MTNSTNTAKPIFSLRNFISKKTHKKGQKFWHNTSTTFVADQDYYERVESVLSSEILPLIQADHNVLDVGCGNGRYSLLFAKRAQRVTAYELSPNLIKEARKTAKTENISNIQFDVQDVLTSSVTNMYDMVSCMGVLICLIEENMFADTLSFLTDRVNPGGYLLLRESVLHEGKKIIHNDTHSGCYRTLKDYHDFVENKGFTLSKDITLATWSEQSTNHLLMYQKNNP